MSEPTPEQVEAAAKALYCAVRALGVRDFEEWPEHVLANKYRAEARAALTAAAGVIPQEPGERAALLAEVIEEHQPYLDQTGVYEGYCSCGEAAESHESHLASVIAELLRGGWQ